jgi:outer membrane immunogenic protein
MKRALIAAIAAIGMASPAFAADIPPAPPPVYRAPVVAPPILFSWTGCHIGLNVGGHVGRDRITTTTTTANFVAGAAAQYDATTPTTLSPTGFIGGGQLGCDYQAGAFVVGLEGDGQGLTGNASRSLTIGPGPAAGGIVQNQTKNSWLSTVRGRAGVAFDRVLVYATGGAAFGGLRTTDSLTAGGATTTVNTTANRVGWTVGGGVEWAFAFNWTARVEYLYVDLGTLDVSIPCVVACVSAVDMVVHHRYTDHIGRFALNYKFF